MGTPCSKLTKYATSLKFPRKNLDDDIGDTEKAMTPETWASLPSKLVFHFFDSFIWTGWRRDLDYGDLYGLTKENRYQTKVIDAGG